MTEPLQHNKRTFNLPIRPCNDALVSIKSRFFAATIEAIRNTSATHEEKLAILQCRFATSGTIQYAKLFSKSFNDIASNIFDFVAPQVLHADRSPLVIGNDPNSVLTAAQQTNARFLQVQLQITPNNIPNLNNLGISLPRSMISILLQLPLNQDGLSLHQNINRQNILNTRELYTLSRTAAVNQPIDFEVYKGINESSREDFAKWSSKSILNVLVRDLLEKNRRKILFPNFK
jgi:hypothetical protein